MVDIRSILRRNLAILIVFVVAAVLMKRTEFIAGAVLGMSIATANFLLLQNAVRRMFSAAAGTVSGQIASYMWQFLLKIVLIAALLFVCVKFLSIDWKGFISGLALSSFIFITEILKLKKVRQCQSFPNR